MVLPFSALDPRTGPNSSCHCCKGGFSTNPSSTCTNPLPHQCSPVPPALRIPVGSSPPPSPAPLPTAPPAVHHLPVPPSTPVRAYTCIMYDTFMYLVPKRCLHYILLLSPARIILFEELFPLPSPLSPLPTRTLVSSPLPRLANHPSSCSGNSVRPLFSRVLCFIPSILSKKINCIVSPSLGLNTTYSFTTG